MGVVVLAGGTGGAKLARGMLDEAGDELSVVVNTADDTGAYGGYVSPDPDLVTFWLADLIDERGWGIAGDTFQAMNQLRDLGDDIWFNLGDRDLAICLWRAQRLAAGERPTLVAEALRRALYVPAAVLPMSDDPVRTFVRARGGVHPFQEFMIRDRGQGPVDGVELIGAENARMSAEVTTALANARAIVIGPSNPVISIGPILAVPGMREAIAASPAAVVAVSPLVKGQVLKGPTDVFMEWSGHPLTSDGIAAQYAGLIDGLIADQQAESIPTLVCDVEMADAAGRRRVARAALEFAAALSG